MTDSNTHFSKAKFMQEGVHDWQSEQGETDTTMICTAIDALVESNLAAAYEQRTANMLALIGQMVDKKMDAAGLALAERLSEQILERLDLA